MRIEDLMREGLQAIEDTTDLVAVVVIFPFRSIERLLSQMNDGIAFKDVTDPGLWYDNNTYTLHFADKKYSTKYRNDPAKTHFVFQALFSAPNETLDYSSIPEPDTNRAYFDSLLHFVKKHPELNSIFAIYSDRIEIKPEHLNDVH
jgi:hypothetical protein